jgi:hypothetical protein
MLPDLITDRTELDVINGTAKGEYDYTDLNRVGEALAYIGARLTAAGYAVDIAPKTDWTIEGIPSAEQMQRYVADVAAIRAALTVRPATPPTPPDMDYLIASEANDIERILVEVDALITSMTGVTLYAPIYTASGTRLRAPEQVLELHDSEGYWLMDADGYYLTVRSC